MTDKPVPLTREGKAKLEHELENLFARRRDVAERIHNAQEQGTSQNDAEYDDAKQEQGMIEGRILEVEDHPPARPTIIDESSAHHAGRVVIGSGVEVDQDGPPRHYQIVGAPEADAAKGKISNESPVGVCASRQGRRRYRRRQRPQGRDQGESAQDRLASRRPAMDCGPPSGGLSLAPLLEERRRGAGGDPMDELMAQRAGEARRASRRRHRSLPASFDPHPHGG